MGKSKKKGLADKVRSKKKKLSQVKPNPFEVKINKVKHNVVNKKVQKWERGTPGLSRSKSVKKRQDTLLRELHHMKKSNSLHDKRFGETDSNLTADEKMVQRFALEKKKQMQKGDFSLKDEEETLTHYGQSLAENLQDTLGSDSEDEHGNIRTGDLQFGGFSKSGEEVSWKDKMREVIADSKKLKYERQVEKEKALEATNELDSGWKQVIYKFQPLKKDNVKKPLSSYLQLCHNLVLEQKSGGGTDKLKTDEERAKEEAELLQTLEAERLSRMQATDSTTERTHVSADDLNDGFALDGSKAQQSEKLMGDRSYNSDGEEGESKGDDNADKEGEGEDGNDKEVEDDGDDEDDDGDDEDDDDDDEDEDESDNYSDLASDDGSESETEEPPKPAKEVKQVTPKASSTKVMSRDLPFVFAAPGSFEELEALLHGHDGEEQAIILSRLRKCHHPSLAEGNKEKLQKIHLYILQYFGQLVSQTPLDQTLVNHLTVCIWEMMQMFKDVTAMALQTYITQRQADFVTITQKRKGRGLMPTVETLLHISLINTLFPASDFRHPVCTPTLHFITQMLTECPVKNGQDVLCGLFLCAQALQFVALSKRYIPEVVTFLQGILMASCLNKHNHKLSVFPPFGAGSKASSLLNLDSKYDCETFPSNWSISEMMNRDKSFFDSDEFKCISINVCVDLLLECMSLWSDIPCLDKVMEPVRAAVLVIPQENFPEPLKIKVNSLKTSLDSCRDRKLKQMQQPSKKPEPLKLFEPKVDEFWSGKRKKGGPNRQANEVQRLNHKYKREMKAAVREIKRDNEVLAKHQLEQVMKKDQERKRKMKDLMHSLASQEGDYKAIKRMKD